MVWISQQILWQLYELLVVGRYFHLFGHCKSCQLLVSCQNIRCSECQTYRPQLNTRSSGAVKEERLVSLKKNVPNKYLPWKNLEQKTKEIQKDRHILKQSNDRLLKRIDKLTVSESVEINSEASDVIINAVYKNESGFSPDSSIIFYRSSKRNQLKKNSSMWWHPVMVRWCLSIYLMSPGQMDCFRSYFFLYVKKNLCSNYYVKKYWKQKLVYWYLINTSEGTNGTSSFL